MPVTAEEKECINGIENVAVNCHKMRNKNGKIVDFIFSKDASMAKYDTLLVEDKQKSIPESIKQLIREEFYTIKID